MAPLLLSALAARLARVLGQRCAQLVEARVGAQGEVGEVAAEALDALALRARQAVELLAQFPAPGALLLAQRVFPPLVRPRVRPAEQEYAQQCDGQYRQREQDPEQCW